MRVLGVLLLLAALVGCAGSSGSNPDSATSATTTAATVVFDQALHDELVAMARRDQSGRGEETSDDRIARLKEIIDEHGWPTTDLVGKEGEDAAWLIAQHADLDPDFQQQALELLRAAVADGQASPGNLAYLEDRVAVANGEPQTYGTQIRCGPNGPVPATPIED